VENQYQVVLENLESSKQILAFSRKSKLLEGKSNAKVTEHEKQSSVCRVIH
jgi:hypothetical protein